LERERRARRGWGSAILTGDDATEEGAMGRARFCARQRRGRCVLPRPAGLVVPFASSADREGGDWSGWRGYDFLDVEKGEEEAKRTVFIRLSPRGTASKSKIDSKRSKISLQQNIYTGDLFWVA